MDDGSGDVGRGDATLAQVVFADCRAPGPTTTSPGWKVKDVAVAPGTVPPGRRTLEAVESVAQVHHSDLALAAAGRSAEAPSTCFPGGQGPLGWGRFLGPAADQVLTSELVEADVPFDWEPLVATVVAEEADSPMHKVRLQTFSSGIPTKLLACKLLGQLV